MAATQTITGQSALRPAFVGGHASRSLIDIEAWMPTEVQAISPLVEQLMQLIEASRCIVGNEFAVELALREAVSNAVIHSNGMDPNKLVEVHCRCERGTGVWLIVRTTEKDLTPLLFPILGCRRGSRPNMAAASSS